MTTMHPALHNRPGQRLPSARQPASHVPRSTFNIPRAPLPSPSYSTTRTTVSFVSPDPKTSPNAALFSSTGPMAKSNPIRFSTKWWDDETGLGWWGYRYYDPGTGRWCSRDPKYDSGIDEEDYENRKCQGECPHIDRYSQEPNDLYTFLLNSTIDHVDSLGLELLIDTKVDVDWCCAIRVLADTGNPSIPGLLWSIPSCGVCISSGGASPSCNTCVEALGAAAYEMLLKCATVSVACYDESLSERTQPCNLHHSGASRFGLQTCCYSTGNGHVDCVRADGPGGTCLNTRYMHVWERKPITCPFKPE